MRCSNEIPKAGGGSVTVKQSYDFNWRIDSGEARLTAKQKSMLLEKVFEAIRGDVLR